ncbi:MAG: peptide chain release factor N(5)-glutamine methyltransferase [Flavobacteriales bacterium]|tara:strand:+ start:1994 stop:2845 length:852 start_codon:yes stop_codon:yes gene_type:complete
MTYIEGRTIFRNELISLLDINEIDFYFKAILHSLFNIESALLALEPHTKFSEDEKQRLKEALQYLLKEKPLQYVLGKTYFREMIINVNSDVLIPRPETEELVSWVLEDHKELKQKQSLIDFGTGSGCISIALAKEQSNFEIKAIDLVDEVLEIAIQNADNNKVSITFIKQDILKLDNFDVKANVVVSNPPYIPPSEKTKMKSNVLNYEPHLALFVPENDPLIFYRSILEYALVHLFSGGFIYFEINPRFLSEMKSLILSFNIYSFEKREDIFGKVRMLRVQKK